MVTFFFAGLTRTHLSSALKIAITGRQTARKRAEWKDSALFNACAYEGIRNTNAPCLSTYELPRETCPWRLCHTQSRFQNPVWRFTWLRSPPSPSYLNRSSRHFSSASGFIPGRPCSRVDGMMVGDGGGGQKPLMWRNLGPCSQPSCVDGIYVVSKAASVHPGGVNRMVCCEQSPLPLGISE